MDFQGFPRAFLTEHIFRFCNFLKFLVARFGFADVHSLQGMLKSAGYQGRSRLIARRRRLP